MAPKPKPGTELPIKPFKRQADLAAWLDKHHASAAGVWIKFAKAASGVTSVKYAEAVVVALCYGWIDGQAKAFDENMWIQRFTPRRDQSVWSKINRAKALKLIEDGHMKPAGLEAIERARKNGRWDGAYDSPANAEVPDDLQKALNKNVRAKRFFATLNSQNRYAILHRVQTAKKAETRASRIAKFVDMLSKGEKLHP